MSLLKNLWQRQLKRSLLNRVMMGSTSWSAILVSVLLKKTRDGNSIGWSVAEMLLSLSINHFIFYPFPSVTGLGIGGRLLVSLSALEVLRSSIVRLTFRTFSCFSLRISGKLWQIWIRHFEFRKLAKRVELLYWRGSCSNVSFCSS